MTELIEAVARVIGHDLAHLCIDPAKGEDAPLSEWEWISDKYHDADLTIAANAVQAYHKVEEAEMFERFGPRWREKLAHAMKQMERTP